MERGGKLQGAGRLPSQVHTGGSLRLLATGSIKLAVAGRIPPLCLTVTCVLESVWMTPFFPPPVGLEWWATWERPPTPRRRWQA